MIHMILTRYRDICKTCFSFLRGFYTGLGGGILCIHSVESCTPMFPDGGAKSRSSDSESDALSIPPQRHGIIAISIEYGSLIKNL